MQRSLLAHFRFKIANLKKLPAFLVRRFDYQRGRHRGMIFHNRAGDLEIFRAGGEDCAAQRHTQYRCQTAH